MTDEQLNEIAQRVSALANVVSTHVGPNHLHVVATHPAPFATIAHLTGDVRAVDVTVATPVPASIADRFREASHAPRAMYDRDGNPDAMNAAKAKGLAADIGITNPPTLSAISGDKLGILFETIEDAQAFDRANATVRA